MPMPGLPMLAAGCDDLAKLRYPLIATAKVDGVRGICAGGEMYSRKLKRFPSAAINQAMWKANEAGYNLEGLDGELILGDDPTAGLDVNGSPLCNRTTSALMTHGDSRPLTWWLFDRQGPGDFFERNSSFRARYHHQMYPSWIHVVPYCVCHTAEAVLECERQWVESKGFEGLVLRDPHADYKHGRSTLREQGLVRWTAWERAEACIVGFEEEMQNNNPLLTNAEGFNKRSSHQENKVGKERLGALVVEDLKTGVQFQVGSGFTAEMREKLWQEPLVGRIITYRFKPVGVKEKPRFPTFVMFRAKLDM